MSADRLSVGVVGVGSLGYHHARILAAMDGVDMAGAFDTDAARLAEVSGQLGVTAASSLDALLSRVDACVIAVPTESH